MIGVELSQPKAVAIKLKCLEAGYLIGSVGENIIRMLPPLIITKEDIDGYIAALDKVLRKYKYLYSLYLILCHGTAKYIKTT